MTELVAAATPQWFTFDNLWAFCDLHASRVSHRRTVDRPMYYDRQGFPIPGTEEHGATITWATLQGNEAYRFVAQDDVPGHSFLSTVWLGLDHGFTGPPLFFETMRFSNETVTKPWPDLERGPAHDFSYHPSMEFPDIFADEPDAMVEQLRYSSEEEALAAHHEIVRRLRVKEGH